MKLNWGHGLLIAIITCTSGLMLLVIISTRQKIDLVTEEYYPKELIYENEIQKLKNTNSLKEPININVEADSLHVLFPDLSVPVDSITGEIWFYFPADKHADKKIDLRLTNQNKQSFSRGIFRRGRYIVIFDWQAGDTKYLQKEMIFIN